MFTVRHSNKVNWRRSSVYITNFEHIQQNIQLVNIELLFQTLNMPLPATLGMTSVLSRSFHEPTIGLQNSILWVSIKSLHTWKQVSYGNMELW